MTFESTIAMTSEFIRAHQIWAAPLVFILAFGESLAFVSLLLPATVLLLALGALIGESGIPFLPIWIAAISGAFFGDWVSYWFGFHYKERVGKIWPLSRQPKLLVRGRIFFERWGVLGVFIGRFFGPLRAVVPLIAGICEMPMQQFQWTNFGSAVVWGTAILAPGVFGLQWLAQWLG